MRITSISNSRAESFVSCRVGLEICNYQEDIARVLDHYNIRGTRSRDQDPLESKGKGNYIIVPLTPPRYEYYDFNNNNHNGGINDDPNISDYLLPDLALDKRRWESEVAVSIGRLPFHSSDTKRVIARFDTLLRHALYLPAMVIVIDVPEAMSTHPIIADVINKRLKSFRAQRLILLRVSLTLRHKQRSPVRSFPGTNRRHNDMPAGGWHHPYHSHKGDPKDMDELTDESGFEDRSSCSPRESQFSSTSDDDPVLCGWASWNSIRKHLVPDYRIGVCLSIEDDLQHDFEEAAKWNGEPVRMIVLNLDRFSYQRGFKKSMRPAGGIKEFIKMVSIANSLVTSLVVQTRADCDVKDHLECLSELCDSLELEYPDAMRCYDDAPLDPLQPLSNNLDSNTYTVFEEDKTKYSRYHDAMLEALDSLLMRAESKNRDKFIIMVLGAGRGPLVDAMISAIHKLKLKNTKTFKIYALDKNLSSIVSLKYKKAHKWNQFQPHIITEVVEADMRLWVPTEKADIIASELLGSFSDNELSPECIDGTWRFTTHETICIPQSYSSYLAPMSSFKMRQEMYKTELLSSGTHHFDRIQVVKLKNHHLISEPQRLFTFKHSVLGSPPKEGANSREETLTFYTSVDTVCDGFAGYFSSKLFGSVTISIVPETKTVGMESWFPVFIPIEKPIQMPANSKLEVKFSRKESIDKVWYEWKIITPEESRIHCLDGVSSSMSKVI